MRLFHIDCNTRNTGWTRQERFIGSKFIVIALLLALLSGASMAEDGLKLPESIAVIGPQAFMGTRAERAVLPEGIERIESLAFADSALKRVNLPRSLSYIASNAFDNCAGLVAEVWEDSYAESWCRQNNVEFTYSGGRWTGMAATELGEPSVTDDACVRLTWAGNGKAVYYAVLEKIDSLELLVVVVKGTTATLTNVTEGTHTYIVRPCTSSTAAGMLGSASNAVTITVSGEQFAGAPLLATASEVSPGKVELSWTGGAASYDVLELFENGSRTVMATTSGTIATLVNVPRGTHTYAVRGKYSGGKAALSDSRPVYVAGTLQSIELDPGAVELSYGESAGLCATLTPAGVLDVELAWSSSDEGVATVSGGVVTACGEGTATITATSGGVSGSCTVHVSDMNLTVDGLVIEHGVVTAYTGDSVNVVIPSGVHTIGAKAFQYKQIESIVIPEGVRTIGARAFDYCNKLGSLTLPNTVTTIGEYAFTSCNALPAIVIPDSVTTLGKGAFNACVGATSITIPESITSIPASAFRLCYNVPSIIIPDSVTVIGNSAFSLCSGLTSIAIPSGVTSIGMDAFNGCSALKSVSIPDTVTSIGLEAFKGCESLTSIDIPDGVTKIDGNAFDGCKALETIRLPEGLGVVSSSLFLDCKALKSVNLPDGATEIQTYVFDGCINLETVNIPGNVKKIGDCAFYNCRKLSTIALPGSVTSIGTNAFRYCDGLAYIVIPDSVTSIDGPMCGDCDGITFAIIGSGVKKLPWRAFASCDNLSAVVIGEGVTEIGEEVFDSCYRLASVLISGDVTKIDKSAFERNVLLYGEPGSYVQQFAADNGLVFLPASEWPGIEEAGKMPISIKASWDTNVMHPGEARPVAVTAYPADQAAARPYRYDSSSPNVAAWDEGRQRLVAKNVGVATITVTSFNGRTDEFSVTVLPEGWSEADWRASLARIDDEYNWMVFFNAFLNGGGKSPKGVNISGIDLGNMTGSMLQRAYAEVLGYSAGTLESDWTKSIVVFHNILEQLSPRKGESVFYASADLLRDLLEKCEIGKDLADDVIEVLATAGYVGEVGVDNFDIARLNQLFDDTMELDNLEVIHNLMVAKTASSVAVGLLKTAELYSRFKDVGMADVEPYIIMLRRSGEDALVLAANELEKFVTGTDDEKLLRLLSYNGFLPATEALLKEFIRELGERATAVVIASLPATMAAAGPAAISIACGTKIGVSVNSLLLNIDDIQEAAFNAQYAINFSNRLLPAFQEAYAAFKDDPMNPVKFNDFALSYITFRELLGEAYDAYAELPRAVDGAAWTHSVLNLNQLLAQVDYTGAVDSAAGFAALARSYMDYDLGMYADALFPGLAISSSLAH